VIEISPRTHLRRLRLDDAPALHEAMRDAQVMAYWSTLPHTALAETQDFVARTIAACEAGEADDFAVVHDGVVSGKAGIWRGEELGFLFARPLWGQGVARPAVEAVLARAFAGGLVRVMADVDPRNIRALAFLRKLGFRITGTAEKTYKLGEVWADSVYLELDAPR
jgi:[ribosomal protein S5]-alanine N-acetyltransferase